MTKTLQAIMMRTRTSIERLESLQQRARTVRDGGGERVVQSALSGLGDVLELLHLAADHLQTAAGDLTVERRKRAEVESRLYEIGDLMPVACLWVNERGDIDRANPLASSILNLSASHLTGRPLMLFLVERQPFVEAHAALTNGSTTAVDILAVVRPRERKARHMHLFGRRLEHDPCTLWWLLEHAIP